MASAINNTNQEIERQNIALKIFHSEMKNDSFKTFCISKCTLPSLIRIVVMNHSNDIFSNHALFVIFISGRPWDWHGCMTAERKGRYLLSIVTQHMYLYRKQ